MCLVNLEIIKELAEAEGHRLEKKGSKFAKDTQIEKAGNAFHVSQFFI